MSRAVHFVLILTVWLSATIAAAQDAAQDNALEHAKSLSKAFRRAAEATTPTVVKIKTRSMRATRGDLIDDFFGGRGGDNENAPPRQPAGGVGSGVIIETSGIVLTNNHVVEGADEVIVQLNDGREFKAADVRTDSDTDLAVVRLAGAKDLPTAKLGNSDDLEIGDWVIAVGNPFELEATVSAGIISAKGRSLGAARRAQFLQTDAAINPGSSGGPLINLDGEVIGINTAIATRTGGYQGIGFSIPINLAKWVIPQLLDKGKVQRAYLGVAIEEVTADLAQKFGLVGRRGVLVAQVYPNTPAAAAQFADGDLILEFAGQQVNSPRDLQAIVERTIPDTRSLVRVLRDGKQQTLEVVVTALPEQFGSGERQAAPDEEDLQGTNEYADEQLGLSVVDMNAATARSLGYEDLQGVLVKSVDVSSTAYRKGLRSGMLILRVDNKPARSVDAFKSALAQRDPKQSVLLQVRARGATVFIVVD